MNDDEAGRRELFRLIREAFGGGPDGPDGPDGPSEARRAVWKRLADFIYFGVQSASAWALHKRRGAFMHRGPAPDVGDVMGRVFEKLWKNSGKALRAWDPDRPFLPYLRIIALNVVRDTIEEANRGPGTDSDPDADSNIGSAAQFDVRDTEHLIATREQLDLVLEAFYNEAPPRERELFDLCIVQEESVQDAARLLHIGENAGSASLLRVRRRLGEIVLRLFGPRPRKSGGSSGAPDTEGGPTNGTKPKNGDGSHNGGSAEHRGRNGQSDVHQQPHQELVPPGATRELEPAPVSDKSSRQP